MNKPKKILDGQPVCQSEFLDLEKEIREFKEEILAEIKKLKKLTERIRV